MHGIFSYKACFRRFPAVLVVENLFLEGFPQAYSHWPTIVKVASGTHAQVSDQSETIELSLGTIVSD